MRYNRLQAAILAGLMVAMAAPAASAQNAAADTHAHDHAHDHDHDHAHVHAHADEAQAAIAKGHFEDAQIQPRALSDWEGDWQSVYPYLLDGTLDPVMAQKAQHGDKSAAQYRSYYEAGYKTDTGRIVIDGDRVTFHGGNGPVTAEYASDGFEVLTYEAGNRGVRYVFRKTAGDASAPGFIQFSDHAIAPVKAGHYHLYWGDDRAQLLDEVANWPTYYPSSLGANGIRDEMLAH